MIPPLEFLGITDVTWGTVASVVTICAVIGGTLWRIGDQVKAFLDKIEKTVARVDVVVAKVDVVALKTDMMVAKVDVLHRDVKIIKKTLGLDPESHAEDRA
jgi:uncharacterized protein YoxC